MKKKKKTAGGRLFYTFGTVFLVALVAVCAMNFARDGRVFQAPLLTAAGASDKQDADDASKASDDYKTIKYNKPDSKTTSKTSSDTAAKGSSGSGKGTGSGAKAQPTVTPDP